MRSIYLMGIPHSGKTALAVGLALLLQARGFKVGYFKPIGRPPRVPGVVEETDAVLMRELLGMEEQIDEIVPYVAEYSYLSSLRNWEEVRTVIKDAFHRLSGKYDLLLIEGSLYPYSYAGCQLDDFSLGRLFNAEAIVTLKVENDFSVDLALLMNNYLRYSGIELVGNVFNNVQRPIMAKAEGIYRPVLEEQGFKVLGIIPYQPELGSPTVQEFYEVLGGELLTAPVGMSRPVEDILIGAMTTESALKYMRRTADKAVILGGDRADIALAALETSTSVLILTGGLYPDVRVLARAKEKGVPVILVHYDTFTTVEKVSRITRQLKPGDRTAIQLARECVEKYVDVEAIISAMG